MKKQDIYQKYVYKNNLVKLYRQVWFVKTAHATNDRQTDKNVLKTIEHRESENRYIHEKLYSPFFIHLIILSRLRICELVKKGME